MTGLNWTVSDTDDACCSRAPWPWEDVVDRPLARLGGGEELEEDEEAKHRQHPAVLAKSVHGRRPAPGNNHQTDDDHADRR